MSSSPSNHTIDRHPTPPLSPSTSLGSVSSSNRSSTSTSSLPPPSPPFQRDRFHPTEINFDSQLLEHRDPTVKLGLMTDRLDKWEEERHERLNSVQASPQSSDHNNVQASLEPPSELISFPFQLESSSSFQSANCPHFHNHFQEEAQLSQRFNPQPSTDVIDVTKLARQDQPPPAYENVDERLPNNASRPSPLTTRASRPLPMPPLDRHNSSTSIHSMANAAADSPTPESHESSSPTTQSYSTPLSSAPSCTNTVLPPGRSFSAHGGTSQLPAGSLGMLHPHDSSSQDWVDRGSTGIHSLITQPPFNTHPPHMFTSESNQHSIPSGSLDHDPSWTQNQPSSSAQQLALTNTVSSRPIPSSGSVQSLSPPPPYSPSEASSSRNVNRPFSEHILNMRATHRSPAVSPALASRGLPPPAPPTILDPPPARSSLARTSRAPHEPFLSDAPPPPDSWIAVETSPGEYRLIARLPGFRRDAITLAARRRRVLHVVADSWEPGGGHFERRISFGYDADLSQVRAEFNGEILRVIVPRRTPAITWYGEACE